MSEFVEITSIKNPIVQRFCDAANGADDRILVADGVRLVGEAIDAGCEIVEIATSAQLAVSSVGRALQRRLAAAAIATVKCSDGVMRRISHLSTHQGVVALVRRPNWQPADLAGECPLITVAAGVRDPRNLGALVRTAEASGASGLIALAGGADPFRNKAVRGSSGSIFRLPVIAGATAAQVLEVAAGLGAHVVVADAAADRDYTEVDLHRPTAIVVGSEGEGIPAVLSAADVDRVRIPMRAPVESLNVAVAAAVMLYEARRQRQ